MPSDELARLKKLTEQLEIARKSAETTAKEVARAQANADKVKKDVRLLDTAGKASGSAVSGRNGRSQRIFNIPH
jgi:hypothetical protein